MPLPGAPMDDHSSFTDSPRGMFDSSEYKLGRHRCAEGTEYDGKTSIPHHASEMDRALELEASLCEASQDVRTLVKWLDMELKHRLLVIDDKVSQLVDPNEGGVRSVQFPSSKGHNRGRRSVIRSSHFFANVVRDPPRISKSVTTPNFVHDNPTPTETAPAAAWDQMPLTRKGLKRLTNSRQSRGVSPTRPPQEPPDLDGVDSRPADDGVGEHDGSVQTVESPHFSRNFAISEETQCQRSPTDSRQSRKPKNSVFGSTARSQFSRMNSGQLQQMLGVQRRFTGRLLSPEHASRLWSFFEEPESSTAAGIYAQVMPWLIMASVILTVMQSGNPAPLTGFWPIIIEVVIDSFYLIEVVLRWAVCPRFWRFLLSGYNLVDLTSVVVMPLRLAILCAVQFDGDLDPMLNASNSEWSRTVMADLLCVTPVIRLLKLLRRFEKFHLLYHAFELAFEALPVLLFTGAILMFTGAGLIYICEDRNNIDSLPRAIWFSITTMTTVGYGDLYPKSTQGTVVTAILIIASALYTAMPLGIVGSAFTRVWEDRDRLLLMQRTKKRLAQWGYTARDITTYFRLFSNNGDGVLNFADFERMIDEMQLGLSSKRVLQLFELFDDDDSGTIDPEEFVAILFPGAVYTMYKDASVHD